MPPARPARSPRAPALVRALLACGRGAGAGGARVRVRVLTVGVLAAVLLATVGCSSAESAPRGSLQWSGSAPDTLPLSATTTLAATTTTTTTSATSATTATKVTTATTATKVTTVTATVTATATATATTVTTTTAPRGTTPSVVPVAEAATAGWGETHAGYPATDIFVAGGCGGAIVSPVNGEVLEVRRIDDWVPAVDDPATRGGRSVAILGEDGVRYYLAHFESIADSIEPGVPVGVGQPLGTVGATGRTSACHVHFGISPPCPEPEWSIRRGVVWPYPYLDAWRAGEQLDPATEVAAWVAANPDACDAAAAP